jgi:hypothetical protein
MVTLAVEIGIDKLGMSERWNCRGCGVGIWISVRGISLAC